MTISLERPDLAPTRRAALRELVLIEARRMVRHPAPWIGLALSVWWVVDIWDDPWSSARYEGLLPSLAPLLLGISLASVSAFGRELVPVAEDAPMTATRRSVARLLAGGVLVALVALVVTGVAVWLRIRGGIPLGDEPGHTDHAHYSVPELLQPVLLACLAVTLGAAVVHLVRQRLVASIVLVVIWFVLSWYWLLNGDVLRWLTPLQVQPVYVGVAPATADPSTFPSSWLLSVPGEFQSDWERLVLSPWLAAWHDLYLVGLVALLAAVAVPGRVRRRLLVVGAVVAVVAVVLQRSATPSADGTPAATGSLAPVTAVSSHATPVVVDTDLGGDDLVALAFLLRHPDVRVEAVTIAGTGLVGCDPGVDLVADLAVAVGHDPVPVACGREDPGPGGRAMPGAWRDAAADGSGIPRSDSTVAATAASAPELMSRLSRDVDGLTVVALGPLTNLADLAESHPASYRRLAGVRAMAGSVDGPLVDGVAEWNAAADPAAFATVLSAPAPLTVVPEDAIPAGTPAALRGPVVGGVAAAVDYPRWWDLATAASLMLPTAGETRTGTWSADESGRLTRAGDGDVRMIGSLEDTALEAAYGRAFAPSTEPHAS